MTCPNRALPLLGLAFILAALVVMRPAPALAQATEATTACHSMLEADYGVDEIRESFERRSSGRRWVHSTATLQDGRTVSYRCLVSYGVVRRVDIQSDGWTEAPQITRMPDEPEETEEAEAEAAPEAEPAARPKTYRVGLGEGYSPKDGITCYRARRACYDAENRLDLETTAAEFP